MNLLKKSLALCLALVLTLSLTACGGQTETEEGQEGAGKNPIPSGWRL